MPHYNGGLFLTEPSDDTDSFEADNARFLSQHAIPDRYLALGLDLLARNVDDKTQALAMIDFKSLGVRQLGSIYEGLLEFKLRVAPRKMAIVKGKLTEEIIPYNEVKKKKRKILTTGRGQNKKERTLRKGAVYLENTRQERKATGSYYTPTYIVKYIVKHTVGPVLEEKFEALKPRLREMERRYYKHRKNAEAKSQLGKYEDPEKFWDMEDVRALAYDILDIKVLDPAMGSGHFLVEAVDFITDQVLDFLNRFPNNPLLASLRRTREAILEAMNAQGVSIDHTRLDPIPLLKRQVLKRAVYGVDLNPMAVELAKVSLWLDAFTLGAPLSFLDHHLRVGNSLIGTTAREADAEMRGETGDQMTLFQGPFVGLLRSAEIMRGIGALADATVEQVHESEKLFEQFDEQAQPYKQMLDVFVIRDFGVEIADEFLIAFGADMMQRDPAELAPQYREMLAERERLYQQYRFFHWDLEFPEVFIDLERAAWKENAGFDAVVGNPPYIRIQALDATEVSYFGMTYIAASKNYDIYALFIEQALNVLSYEGRQSFIVPHKFFEANYGKPLRGILASGKHLSAIVHFGHQQLFAGSTTYTCVLILSKAPTETFQFSRVSDIPAWLDSDVTITGALTTERVTDASWNFVVGSAGELFDKLNSFPLKLTHVTDRIFQGLKTSADDVFIVDYIERNDNKTKVYSHERGEAYWLESDLLHPLIKGGDSIRYHISHTNRLILFPYAESKDGDYGLIPKSKLEMKFPLIWAYLRDNKGRLQGREKGRMKGPKWYGYIYPKSLDVMGLPKIFTPDIAERSSFSLDSTGDTFFTGGVSGGYGVLVSNRDSTEYVLTLLNSWLLRWYVHQVATSMRGGYFSYESRFIKNLPIYSISFTTSSDKRMASVEHMVNLYGTNDFGDVLSSVESSIKDEASDIVHDILKYLSQQMIDLNKQRQAEIRRFLGWLEGQLGASIDDLQGKTIIKGYLGDYQKGEGELPIDELLDRLHKNRSKISANLSDAAFVARLQDEYEASLATLLPIKQRLAETDWLIDQIVYKLYGLTEEEIAIVEGRA